MIKFLKFLWGNPLPMRIAASVSIGVILGICAFATPVWFIIFSCIFIFRTHLLSSLAGWLAGLALGFVLNPLYEPVGRFVLVRN